MITIGGRRENKAGKKTADSHDIEIGVNNIGSGIGSSKDSNKVLTKDDNHEDNISDEEGEDGDSTNISKDHGRVEKKKRKQQRGLINDEEDVWNVAVKNNCSNNKSNKPVLNNLRNKKSNKHEGDSGNGDDNYNMAGMEQIYINSIDDGVMYVIKNIHKSSNKTQVKVMDNVKRIDDSLGTEMTKADRTNASVAGRSKAWKTLSM